MTLLHRTGLPSPHPRPVLRIALADDLASLAAGIEFTSHGRFLCDAPPSAADLLLIPPDNPARLQALRSCLPAAVDMVVVDRKAACHPRIVADCLEAGAVAVVAGSSYTYLVSQLDVVAAGRATAADVRTGRRDGAGWAGERQ
jgi:hypothetical protein